MKLGKLEMTSESGKFLMLLEVTGDEAAAILMTHGLLGAGFAPAEPAKRTRKVAPEATEAPKSEPVKAEPKPEPTVTTTMKPAVVKGTNGAAANGTPAVDLDIDGDDESVPAELASAKVLSEVVRYFMTKGVTTKAEMIAEVETWKKKGGDKIPVLARIENLGERIERGGTAMGLT